VLLEYLTFTATVNGYLSAHLTNLRKLVNINPCFSSRLEDTLMCD